MTTITQTFPSITAEQRAKMIARRVRRGGNADQSARVLAELEASHEGYNLLTALVYNDFITVAAADKMAGV